MSELQQLSLLDYAAAQAARDQGIDRAATKAGNVWTGYALDVLERLCRTQPTVWAGDLRKSCVLTPASRFAWAAPWRMALRRGWLDPTPIALKPADWPAAHVHQSPVYRSRLYGAAR